MPVTSLRTPRPAATRDRLLTLEEAADHLGIAAGTLKHWAHAKRVEHVKVGKYIKFTQAALDRYIQSKTVAAVGD